MTTHVQHKVIAVLNDVLDISLRPEENPNRNEIANWDSLKHMELILRLEEEFQVRFSVTQVGAIESVSDIITFIEANEVQ